ncbi:hypothetical protein F4779DRAFT_406958 [Xylariaceae sp. FL0662B]|nr:hypothetical protein F4779DRAFT_406958 [Xylariaceae sp. FL0662B]
MSPVMWSIFALYMIQSANGHQAPQGPDMTGISFVTKVRSTTTVLEERDCLDIDANVAGSAGTFGCLPLIVPIETTNPEPPKCSQIQLGPIEDGDNIEVGTGCEGFDPDEKVTFTLAKTTKVAATTFTV